MPTTEFNSICLCWISRDPPPPTTTTTVREFTMIPNHWYTSELSDSTNQVPYSLHWDTQTVQKVSTAHPEIPTHTHESGRSEWDGYKHLYTLWLNRFDHNFALTSSTCCSHYPKHVRLIWRSPPKNKSFSETIAFVSSIWASLMLINQR